MAVKKYEANGIVIEIDLDKCMGAGECVDVCPVEVFELVDEKSTAPNIVECTECCLCVDSCPADAITHSSC
ncbi:MAG: 4Fe-4S binding protein [Methanosarcinales archaeon]|nr:4Fe-4S binding protein [Methanosarcinales archaeon]